nr:hypothetical protein GCM10020185_60660 [Pseudomonas brassicacearum subsp. brassicacearum]
MQESGAVMAPVPFVMTWGIALKDVLIVDDHPVIRGALRLICQNEAFTHIRDAGGTADARALIKECAPDLVILDLVMNGFDGLDLLVWIMAQFPECSVLVFTSQDAQHFCNRCISAGARGFVTKKSDLKELTKAIQALKSGYAYFSTNVRQAGFFSNAANSRPWKASPPASCPSCACWPWACAARTSPKACS